MLKFFSLFFFLPSFFLYAIQYANLLTPNLAFFRLAHFILVDLISGKNRKAQKRFLVQQYPSNYNFTPVYNSVNGFGKTFLGFLKTFCLFYVTSTSRPSLTLVWNQQLTIFSLWLIPFRKFSWQYSRLLFILKLFLIFISANCLFSQLNLCFDRSPFNPVYIFR